MRAHPKLGGRFDLVGERALYVTDSEETPLQQSLCATRGVGVPSFYELPDNLMAYSSMRVPESLAVLLDEL